MPVTGPAFLPEGEMLSEILATMEGLNAIAAAPLLNVNMPDQILGIGARQLMAQAQAIVDSIPTPPMLPMSLLPPMPPMLSPALFDTISRSIAAAIGPLHQNIIASLSNVLAAIPDIDEIRRGVFPSNLLDADVDLDLDALADIMLAEGLPLAWIPRTQIIRSVLLAPDAAARRTVYGRRWLALVEDCEQALATMSSAEVAAYVGFALKSARGLREGHHELSQAFTASTLDTLVRKVFSTDVRKEITGRERPDLDEYTARQFFAFSQIWGIHRTFYPSNGDPIPGTFNRHGSAHGVSRRQYSRINSVIGLVHLTSFLWFLDQTYSRGHAT